MIKWHVHWHPRRKRLELAGGCGVLRVAHGGCLGGQSAGVPEEPARAAEHPGEAGCRAGGRVGTPGWCSRAAGTPCRRQPIQSATSWTSWVSGACKSVLRVCGGGGGGGFIKWVSLYKKCPQLLYFSEMYINLEARSDAQARVQVDYRPPLLHSRVSASFRYAE